MRAAAILGAIVTVVLAVLTVGLAPAEEAGARREAFDLRYHTDSPRQVLDVFRPAGDAPAPVVLFLHGGGWTIGDKNFFGLYRGVGRWFARQGYVAVLANYRLSPQVRHPEHARDVARAFAWVRKHAKEYGGDPDRVVLAGHSAGGHLATLIASAPDYLAEADRPAVKAVVGISGVYRIPDQAEIAKVGGNLVAGLLGVGGPPAMPAWLRKPGEVFNPLATVFGTDRTAYPAASPITHVRKDLPPHLVLYSGLEIPPLGEQAAEYADTLRKVGADVTVEKIADADHNTIAFRLARPDDPTAKAIGAFLKRAMPEARP